MVVGMYIVDDAFRGSKLLVDGLALAVMWVCVCVCLRVCLCVWGGRDLFWDGCAGIATATATASKRTNTNGRINVIRFEPNFGMAVMHLKEKQKIFILNNICHWHCWWWHPFRSHRRWLLVAITIKSISTTENSVTDFMLFDDYLWGRGGGRWIQWGGMGRTRRTTHVGRKYYRMEAKLSFSINRSIDPVDWRWATVLKLMEKWMNAIMHFGVWGELLWRNIRNGYIIPHSCEK